MTKEQLDKKIDVLLEMEKAIQSMNYIKALDTASNKVTDLKLKRTYHQMFVTEVEKLRFFCKELKLVLEEWFRIEKENNLEIDLNLRNSYKAICGF